jgi:hypothetical protein
MTVRSPAFVHVVIVAAAALLALPACGDDDDDAPAADAGADATPPPADAGTPPLLEPPPAGEGIQLHMVTTLGAGVEAEHCQFVKLSADATLWVNRDEVRYGKGSHHFLLYATAYTDIPTAKEDGTPVDTSRVFDCSDGATNGWQVTKLVGGSQNGEGDSLLRFPSDVAIRIPAGSVLLMNAHYINATDAEIAPDVYINLWTIPEAQVKTEGDILFLYNPFIKVGALGTGRARWRCPVQHDITIANVQSHMHRRGTGYEATVVGADTPFYVGESWENVHVERFEPNLQLKAGEVIDYHCDYTNPENRVVYQGARSTDEMCMLIGSYYPADRATAQCEDAQGHLAGEWVGNGTATCAATWTCIKAASQGKDDGLAPIIDCVDAASPDVAAESSALLRCVMAKGAAACGTEVAACEAK